MKLDKELTQLGAQELIIQTYFWKHQMRPNGWPRPAESPVEPGVVIAFRCGNGESLSLACDRHDHWLANLWAILLTLEALRRVDHLGVSRSRQYRGFAVQAARRQESGPEQAAEVLAAHSGIPGAVILQDAGVFRDAYRRAALATHPDRGGDANRFLQIDEAKRVLENYFGL